MSDTADTATPKSGPPPGPAVAVYHDGRSPFDWDVVVSIEGFELVIAAADGRHLARWPLEHLHLARGTVLDGEIRLRNGRGDLDRLTLHDPAIVAYLMDAVPHLKEERVADMGGLRRVLGIAAVVVGIVGLMLFLALPTFSRQVVSVVPMSWEMRLGEAVAEAIISDVARQQSTTPQKLLCTGAAGTRALNTMVERLAAPLDLDVPLTVRVVNSDIVNAFAMPGGQVLIFRGLFDFAQTADEVAGVIAHELIHVDERHPNRKLVETGATNLVLSLILGDFAAQPLALTVGQMLVSARYSRAMEREADAKAVDIMRAAGVSPQGLAQFLDRVASLQGESEKSAGWFMSHPPSRERSAAIRERAGPGGQPPILDAGDYFSLRIMCAPEERRPQDSITPKDKGGFGHGS